MHARSEPGPPQPEPDEDGIVVLHGISWALYEQILAERGDRSTPRIAYLEGELELMSPSYSHEAIKTSFARMVEIYALHNRLPLIGVGSWTLKEKPEARGVEPDECYIVGREEKERPDFAIEVVWTHGGVDKLDIYRKLGVREVWIWTRRTRKISVHALRGEVYEQIARSEVLPDLDLPHLSGFLEHEDQGAAVQAYWDSLGSPSRS